ncbi:MAG: NADH-quinone oxidoreductase subunit NuoE [Clostridiaceae bacterium]|nr:NADH-quinone oxidoreductase subunit NuoE [Clostridiaceae bacterium]
MDKGTCCCGCIDEKEQMLESIMQKHKNRKGALIPILHEAQELYGYLPLKVQRKISESLDIPLSEIYGVITFYAQFSLKPKGVYNIQVCMGTACYVRGASLVLEKLQERLGIHIGECTEDGLFSLEVCRCVGACGLAPVMMINGEVYGTLNPEKIEKIIEKYEKQGKVQVK